MKIKVIDLYKDEFDKAYLQTNKDNRKRVLLFSKTGESKWISYARYLWEENYGKIPEGFEVDHINNDKTDDRLENLQLLTREENIKKNNALRHRTLVKLICPICGKEFYFEKRNLSTHRDPCCSKQCGYKKGVLTRETSKSKSPLNGEPLTGNADGDAVPSPGE